MRKSHIAGGGDEILIILNFKNIPDFLWLYYKKYSYICTQYDLPRFPLEQRTRGGLRVFIRMEYSKKPLSLSDQIDKLTTRGLVIDDRELTKRYLSNISYYRLRAYTYPFQNNEEGDDHEFIRKDIHFSDIIDLYCFDRRLRTLIFNAIEKIEVAVRTKIVQIYSEATGDSNWYENESLFKDDSFWVNEKDEATGRIEKKEVFQYDVLMDDIASEVKRSNEDFIKHFYRKYSEPKNPPAWMTLEVISFGTLSRLFELLKKSSMKDQIAKEFGLPDDRILANWLHAIAVIRNCCAHHSRIWNRRYIVSVKLPYNTTYPFIDRDTIKLIRSNKLFAVLSCIKYFSDIISPGSDLKRNFLFLLGDGGQLLSMKEMGFPTNWKYLDVWKDK